MALLFTVSIFAMGQDSPEVDVNDASSLVTYLTPFIVLGATWLIRLVKPSIPGWATMVVVLLLSSATTFLTNTLGNPDLGWLQQFGLGLASTFVHQIYVQFKGDPSE